MYKHVAIGQSWRRGCSSAHQPSTHKLVACCTVLRTVHTMHPHYCMTLIEASATVCARTSEQPRCDCWWSTSAQCVRGTGVWSCGMRTSHRSSSCTTCSRVIQELWPWRPGKPAQAFRHGVQSLVIDTSADAATVSSSTPLLQPSGSTGEAQQLQPTSSLCTT